MCGKKIRQLRLDKNITQAELANLLNVSVSTIASYEIGRRKPRPDSLQTLADYFKVSVDYFTENVDDSYSPSTDIDFIKEFGDFKKDTSIIYNDVDITDLIWNNTNSKTQHDSKQILAWMEFMERSGHARYARGNLLYILNKIRKSSYEYIAENLNEFSTYIEKRIILPYKRCWNNIDNLFFSIDSCDTLFIILNRCINLDSLAVKEFSFIPLDKDFKWLRDKFSE